MKMKRQKKLDKKRRKQSKTNYKKRLNLLKGNYPRLVVRKSNKYITIQIIKSKNAQDKVLYMVNSKELLKHGWPEDKSGSLKNLSASYLAGFLLGKKAKTLKQELILDSGLIPSTKGSRVYAAVKGVSDAGLKINFSKGIAPSQEKIENKEFFNKIKGGIK